MALDNSWFTEICSEADSAFSLKIKEKLHSEKSKYQTIDIYATEKYGNLMVIDGFIMVTDLDNAVYHEMLSHPALFTHNQPEQVAIIGGGDCGTLKEVLKHSAVKQASLVEIDELVTNLAKQYFPQLTVSLQDPRANLCHEDGLKWMKRAKELDVIIIDSTDPIGPAADLFSKDFYIDCLNALTQDGLLIQQSESPLFHMNILRSMHDAMLAAGFRSTQTLHFFQSSYPSGWWTCTMAAKSAIDLQKFNRQKSLHKPFDTFYYNSDVHQASFAAPEFVKQKLNSQTITTK